MRGTEEGSSFAVRNTQNSSDSQPWLDSSRRCMQRHDPLDGSIGRLPTNPTGTVSL